MDTHKHEEYFGTDSDEEYEDEKEDGIFQGGDLDENFEKKTRKQDEEIELEEKDDEEYKELLGVESTGDNNIQTFGKEKKISGGAALTRDVSCDGAQSKSHYAKKTTETDVSADGSESLKSSQIAYKVPKTEKVCGEIEEIVVVRLPSFLDIKYEEFDEERWALECYERELEEAIASEDNVQLKIENCIRWRYKRNEDGKNFNNSNNTVETNAKLVKWSNDTYSLLLGTQLFDAPITTNLSPKYLGIRLGPGEKAMIVKVESKKTMTLRLYSQSKDTENLRRIIVQGHTKKAKTKGFFSLDDSEKGTNATDKLEIEKFDAQKQPRSKQYAAEKNYNLSISKHIALTNNDKINGPEAETSNHDDHCYEGIPKDHYHKKNTEKGPEKHFVGHPSHKTKRENDYSDAADDIYTQSSGKKRAMICQDEVD